MCIEIICSIVCLVSLLIKTPFVALVALVGLLKHILWKVFFTDRDSHLAVYEWIGSGVKKYGKGVRMVVWITGANTTLGQAMAFELAEKGTKLILSDDKDAPLDDIKIQCLAKSKGKLADDDVLVLYFQLKDYKVIKRQVDIAVIRFGKIDVLIGNLGKMDMGPVVDSNPELDKETMIANFFGIVSLTKVVVKQFKKQESGRICILSSVSGKFGIPGQAAYCASKHALHGYFDALRLEYIRYNIHVTIVCLDYFERVIGHRDITLLGTPQKILARDRISFARCCLKVERIAHLILVAVINNLSECRIAKQPYLIAFSFYKYLPDIAKMLAIRVYNKERLAQMFTGRWPISTWKTIFVL